MQIARVCPRAVAGFSSSLRRVCLASAIALPLLGSAVWAAPTDHPAIDPDQSLTGWTLAGIAMMQRGDLDAAWSALSHATALAPHDLHLRADALHYAAMSGHMTEALDLARTLPADDISTLLLSQDALLNARWAEFHHILSGNSHPGALMAAAQPVLDAWALAAQGQPDKALARLTDAAALPATRRFYLLQAAMIAEQLPDPARATALYAQTGTSHSDPISLQIVYAQIYGGWLIRQDRKADATRLIDALSGQLPSGKTITLGLAKSLAQQARPTVRTGLVILNMQLGLMLADAARGAGVPGDMGIMLLQQAHTIDPSLGMTEIMLADLLRENGHDSSALDALSHLPASSPFAPLAAQERIDIAIHMHDLALEKAAFEQALTLFPGNPDYLVQLGSLQDQLGQPDAAIASYSSALSGSTPRKSLLWPILLGRAMAYQEKGDWAHTQDDMQHAFALAPDEPEVLNFIGYASIEHGVNIKEALGYLRRALDLRPGDASIQDSYAWALLKDQADIEHALPLLIQAAEHDPNDPEIGYHLGVAYWYLGRKMEARDQWNQALADQPGPADRALLTAALQNGPQLASFERRK